MSSRDFYWALPNPVPPEQIGAAMVMLSAAYIEHTVKPDSKGQPEILFRRKSERNRAIELFQKKKLRQRGNV